MNNFFNKNKIFIIAEISGNHLQDISKAEKLIKKSYEAGADAIKIQTYTPDTMSMNLEGIKEELKRKYHTVKIDHPDWKGMSYNELYNKVYTPWEWHSKLNEVAKNYNLPLFSSPFDETAVDFLEKQNVPLYKIASYDVINIPLLKKVAQTGKPTIMSVGMASEEEISEAVNTLKENGCPEITLLHCISSYPAKDEDLNLSKIQDLKKKFNYIVGFSDHSLNTDAPAIAVALGAKIIERHITLDRNLGGPDSSFSTEPHEFKEFVEKIRDIEKNPLSTEKLKEKFPNFEKMYGTPFYGPINQFEKEGIKIRPSIWAAKDIQKGKIIKTDDLKVVRPGAGLSPKYLKEIIGKKAKINIKRGAPFSWDLVES